MTVATTNNDDRDQTATIITSGINEGKTAEQIAHELHTPDQAANVAAIIAALDTITAAHVQANEAEMDSQDEQIAAFDKSHAHLPADSRPRMIFA